MLTVLDNVKTILIILTFAGMAFTIAYVLKMKRDQIISTLNDLIQRAEQVIQGSGLGTEKKDKVIAQLKAMGINVTAWMETEIDNIVKNLNTTGGWLVDTAIDEISQKLSAIDVNDLLNKISTEISSIKFIPTTSNTTTTSETETPKVEATTNSTDNATAEYKSDKEYK